MHYSINICDIFSRKDQPLNTHSVKLPQTQGLRWLPIRSARCFFSLCNSAKNTRLYHRLFGAVISIRHWFHITMLMQQTYPSIFHLLYTCSLVTLASCVFSSFLFLLLTIPLLSFRFGDSCKSVLVCPCRSFFSLSPEKKKHTAKTVVTCWRYIYQIWSTSFCVRIYIISEDRWILGLPVAVRESLNPMYMWYEVVWASSCERHPRNPAVWKT